MTRRDDETRLQVVELDHVESRNVPFEIDKLC